MDELKNIISNKIEAEKEELFSLSRRINSSPELAYEEFNASSWLCEYISDNGFKVETGVGGLPTAFTATIKNGNGPTVAFLAEYDALPTVGHGCGHNLIGTAAVGAAVGISAISDEIAGVIKVIGTPAEEFTEGKAGKIRLLESGAFSGVDVCLMFHPWTETAVPLKDFGFIILDITFLGKPAHAAADPWNGLNALDAVVVTYNNVSVLRQQLKPDTRVHCMITHGGDAVNVIPSKASIRLMFRSPEARYLEELSTKVESCARGAALATGTIVDVNQVTYVKPSRFNAVLYEIAKNNLNMLGEDLPQMLFWGASSDFGNLSQEIPALSMLVKTHADGINWHSEVVAHSATSDEAHASMLRAAKVMAMSAFDLIIKPDLVRDAKLDFEAR